MATPTRPTFSATARTLLAGVGRRLAGLTDPTQVREAAAAAAAPPVIIEPLAPSQPEPVRPNARVLEESIFTGVVPRTEVFNRIYQGRNIDLDRIEAAIRWSEVGVMGPMADLSRETLHNDPTLSGYVQKRIGNLAVVDYDITPAAGGGIDPDLAKTIADDVRTAFRGIEGFRQAIYDLGWGVWDGRAAQEIQWRYVGGPRPWNPQRLDWIHPGRLVFGPERELRVKERGRQTGYFHPDGPALRDMPGKFIWWLPRMFGDYPEREGLAPRCLYWSFFKRFSWRHRMILTELFGIPWRIVETDREAPVQGDAITKALATAEALGSQTAAAFLPGQKLRVEAPHPESGTLFGMTSDEVNAELAKLVLLQTGTTTSDANRASAVVASAQQDLVFMRDGNGVSERIKTQLVDVYVELNWGADRLVYAPTFTLRTQPPRDRIADLTRIEKVISFGVDVAEAEIREASGLRKPMDNEPVIRRTSDPTTGAPTSAVFDPTEAVGNLGAGTMPGAITTPGRRPV